MKKSDDTVLGGFSAVFSQIGSDPIDPSKLKDFELPPTTEEDGPLDLTKILKDDEEDDDFETPLPFDDKNSNDNDGDSNGDGPASNGATEEVEDTAVAALFDAIAESAGWGVDDSIEKPKTAEELIEYMKSVVEESSTPEYANEDVAALDEYIRNGGSLETYLSNKTLTSDYSSIDLTNESAQKSVLREFLAEKGYSDVQIRRKIEKYEDADLLEDEATEALELLKEIKEEKKKALLEEQKISNQRMIQEQQTFYNNVVNEIEALTDIRGINIPKQDKQTLKEYLLKVEADGRTKYQKDYAKSTKNLIESAYFTMKGDSLLNTAKKSGETSAVEKLKNTLNSTKVGGSKQTINNGSARPLWSVASTQLLRTQK